MSFLRELLNVYWLRPETALWRAIDIEAMKGFEVRGRSLDFGCGDGLFSFIRAGGRFDASFDAFQSVRALDRFFDKVDVYDSSAPIHPMVAKTPSYRFGTAFDHKENLLKKAKTLKLYGRLVRGDGNAPLPFEDGAFDRVFSNIVYWLDEPARVFEELCRVLSRRGRACVMLPNKTLPEFSFYYAMHVKTKDPRFAFLSKLDRGRFTDNIKQAKSASEWERLFKSAGLRVASHRRHLSKTVVQMWDVGLRPLFPVLCRLAAAAGKKDLPPIKREWTAIFEEFLSPLVPLDAELIQGREPAFHCYILEKP